MREWRVILSVLLAATASAAAALPIPVTDGLHRDYQPSVIRTTDNTLVVVFERLDGALSGDLWVTRSIDEGATWTPPAAIIASGANERHPALLQLGPTSFVLFYLKGTGATSSFRIWRATSSDGIAFTEQTALDLGWATGGEINPHVIRHANGTLTMSYQRLGSGSHVAQSADGGVTWDTLRTSIAAGTQLPRIAFRESDGRYLASYQVGSSALQMRVKTTTDVYDWSAPAQDFAIDGNNHDSLPVVMPDDAFVLFWIVAGGGQFDIVSRRSLDGLDWQPRLWVGATPTDNDVQPHPLVGSASTHVQLYWGRESPAGGGLYTIVRDPAVAVVDALFAHGFED